MTDSTYINMGHFCHLECLNNAFHSIGPHMWDRLQCESCQLKRELHDYNGLYKPLTDQNVMYMYVNSEVKICQ